MPPIAGFFPSPWRIFRTDGHIEDEGTIGNTPKGGEITWPNLLSQDRKLPHPVNTKLSVHEVELQAKNEQLSKVNRFRLRRKPDRAT